MTRALLIAAPASGQGKTTITCALAWRLRREGQRVRAFKVGPDFIDPGFLEAATGAPADPLDLWMVGPADCARQLAAASREADWVLVEAAMGLYDGAPSAADLAEAFGLPVLAVIDAHALAQTFGALALGLRQYRHDLRWAGVLANRVAGPGHAQMLRESLGDALPWLGHAIDSPATLPQRHLGLVQAQEIRGLALVLEHLAEALVIDVDGWRGVPHWTPPAAASTGRPVRGLQGRTIAIARDDAFSFCYAANLRALEDLGADLCFFSPLAGEPVPAHAHALYLPGGYPELHAARLAAHLSLKASLRAFHEAGRPIVAECGGLMLCAAGLCDLQGRRHAMAGLLPLEVEIADRPQAVGLQAWPDHEGGLRGHAFHYGRASRADGAAPAFHTVPHRWGAPEPVWRDRGLTASFFHAYFPSDLPTVARLFSS